MKRTIKTKPYVIALVLIALVFSALNYFLVGYIRTLLLRRLEEESRSYASVFSHSLMKSREAYRAINNLLEARLLAATSTAALFSNEMTDEALQALAESMSVDEIYIYNPEGIIEVSTRPEYLGWEALPGHPVYDFMISGAESLVEGIRKDSESDRYFKYAYVRLDDGRFVQLGISADSVRSFLSAFELEKALGEIAGFQLVDHACFVGPDFTVIASAHDHVGLLVDDPAMRETVLSGEVYSMVRQTNGDEMYDIFVPVHLDGELVGVLVVGKSASSTLAALRTTTLLVFGVTSFVCFILVYVMYSNLRHNQELVTLAYHDTLTGLPNKVLLEEVLADLVERKDRSGSAVLLVHFRNLNDINSIYGFDAGDRLMHQVGEKLAALAENGRRLFRFSGSRFVFLVQGYQSRDELVELAEKIRGQAEEGLEPIGHHLEVGTGIVELASVHGDPAEVITQAAVAVQHLENRKTGPSYAFFDVEMAAKLRREEIIAQELRRFVGNPDLGTVYLHYQPKVEIATGKVVGFEALARMNSPSLGLVSPVEFIAIAERQGLITPLGYFVLERACRFIQRLKQNGHSDQHVAVNISVLQLVQEDFPKRVAEILAETGTAPEQIQLEITESVIIEDFAGADARLQPLRALGVSIALDDFGTGYSALSRLEELPIDCIKIDKRFIDNMMEKDRNRLFIKDLISMCHKMGLEVVAEGVEHERQLRYLAESDCDIMQGYYHSRPMVEEDALAQLAS